MTRPPVIGLVGGVGSGKSAVAAALARRGGTVVEADQFGHLALGVLGNAVRIAELWPEAVSEFGIVDRKVLAAIVFADDAARNELERIVHPWIIEQIRGRLALLRHWDYRTQSRFVVLDAPLLFEAGLKDECDIVAFIDAPLDVRLGRVAGRGWSAADLHAREAAQMSLDEKRRLSDIVIDNVGSRHELDAQVERLLKRFREASLIGEEGGHRA